MALILNIETSTTVCSAALSKDGNLLDLRETFDDRSHASQLTVLIDELFKNNSISYADFDAISVSEGPGSYTGLRIGVSVAKGICYAQNKPLIAVDTLQAMALMAIETNNSIESNSILCPMIDARRMEVYTAFYDTKTNKTRETKAEIIENNSYLTELTKQKVYFMGNGAEKCKEAITHENAIFLDNIYTSAKYMGELSQKLFDKGEFKDVAYFEPFYLKDFVATTPKRKVL